jgi:hypothetical protein
VTPNKTEFKLNNKIDCMDIPFAEEILLIFVVVLLEPPL